MAAIVIRRIETDEVVHRIDVTGKTDRQIDRIEMGLAVNFDFDANYFGVEDN